MHRQTNSVAMLLYATVVIVPRLLEGQDRPLRVGAAEVAINDVRHWYRIAGARTGADPLVIVHGGPGGNTFTFERTIGPELEKIATVIYYHQRGSGRSAAPADSNAYDLATLVADLDGLRAHLGLKSISVLGYSFGGELALNTH